MHTLSGLLFHPNDILQKKTGSQLFIIPGSLEAAENLPPKLGNVIFAVPKSLRKDGSYLIVELKKDMNQGWNFTIENCFI